MITDERDIQLLDCTLRDGGLGLEDLEKNNIANVSYDNCRSRLVKKLNNINLEILELGTIRYTDQDRSNFAIYPDIETLSQTIPTKRNSNTIYVGLFAGPDTPLNNIPEHNLSLLDGLRVIIRYSELDKSLKFCAALAEKGYYVFIQPMLTMRYSSEEIQKLIDYANMMNAYALYFVDSYGYMQAEDIEYFFRLYNGGLDPGIRIGFHGHNNMNLAFANAQHFLRNNDTRKVILDSCVMGIGQGAGNLQTEIITDWLNYYYGKNYCYDAVLECCELLETLCIPPLWGYSVTRLIPALRRTAYKYAVALRYHYRLSYVEINRLLSDIPENLKHRYTPENTKKLLTEHGYQV